MKGQKPSRNQMQNDYFLESKMYSYNFEWLSDPRKEQNGGPISSGFAKTESSFTPEMDFPAVIENNPVWTFDTEYNTRPEQDATIDEYTERKRKIKQNRKLWNRIWRPFFQMTPIHGLRKLQQDTRFPVRR